MKRDLKQAAMQQLLTGQNRLPGFHGEWEVTTLGDLATVSAGGTPSRAREEYWGGDIPWVTTSEVDFYTIESAEQFITTEGLANSAAKLLPPGTLLMALYGQGKTRGKIGILGVSAATNQACAAISLCRTVFPVFIFYSAHRCRNNGRKQLWQDPARLD
jgi:type I restriction enzyme S subunit